MKTTLQEGNSLPQPIVDGITSSFTHLSHSYESGLPPEDQARHISLAMDALIETTYLCYEIIVISIGSEISAVCDDPRTAKFGININYSDFKREHARFKTVVNDAKKSAEMKSGKTCKAAIKAYDDAIIIGESLLGKIDWVKVEDLRQESEQAATLANIQEANLSAKDRMIEALTNQLSLHPKRSLAAIVVIFVVYGFANTILKDFFDKILFPHFWSYLNNSGLNLTAIFHR